MALPATTVGLSGRVPSNGEAPGVGSFYSAVGIMSRDRAGWNRSRLAPFSSQVSPALIAITWALEIIGTASNSNVSRVLPGSRRASARCRSMHRRSRSASSCSVIAARKRAAGHPSLLACSANCGYMTLMDGRRSSLRSKLSLAESQRGSSSCRISLSHCLKENVTERIRCLA